MFHNNCSDFFYTIPNATELCTGTLEDKYATALLVIRISLIGMLGLFSILFSIQAYQYGIERNEQKRKSQRYKRISSRAFSTGNIMLTIFYVLGNNFRYPHLSHPTAFVCTIAVFGGSVSMLFGVTTVLLMVMQVHLISWGDSIGAIVPHSMTPVLRLVVPYTMILLVAICLMLAGVIDSAIVAQRVSFGAAVPSLSVYVREVRIYTTPVITTMGLLERTISTRIGQDSEEIALLKTRIRMLKQQRSHAIVSSGIAIIVFSILGFSPLLHEPSGLLLLLSQSYGTISFLGASILGYTLVRDKGTSRISTQKRAMIVTNHKLFESSVVPLKSLHELSTSDADN